MELDPWIAARGGIAHRQDILDAGFGLSRLRAFMRRAEVSVLRRTWVALPSASEDLRLAAEHGGRIACVSVARRRGWWMPHDVDSRTHVHLHPGAAAVERSDSVVRHWTRQVAPTDPRSLEESTEDALAHIATCLPRDQALVLWESALRSENLSADAVRSIRWRSRAAAECAQLVTGLSDSGLETILVMPLRRWGVGVRQQIVIAGRRVDALVGERLVLQVDGYEFHSDSAQRSKDIAHDAELRLRGYTVLRFSYAQVVHDGPTVERMLRRAIAAGLHLAPASQR